VSDCECVVILHALSSQSQFSVLGFDFSFMRIIYRVRQYVAWTKLLHSRFKKVRFLCCLCLCFYLSVVQFLGVK